ncbi:MAG: FtsX-like permease family protein [Candidatus Anammoxibacter sp.]
MYKIIVSLRYLRRKKVTIIALTGIAIGVMTLIIVLSVMKGFDRELRTRIRGTLSHIVVLKNGMYGFENYKEIIEILKTFDHIEACAPYIEGPALMRKRGIKEFVYFKGIDPIAEARVGDFANYISIFNTKPQDLLQRHNEKKIYSAFGGIELLRIGPGDFETNPENFLPNMEKIVLVTLKGWDSISVKPFVLAGKFRSGMYDFDKSYIYIPLAAAQELAGSGDSVTGIEIKLDNYKYASDIRDFIQKELGASYFVQTWEDSRKTFLTAVTIERRVMTIILGCIIIVAGFSILAILRMVVLEKMKDIGILKALGATSKGIMTIFLLNGLFIGIIGTGIGVIVGLSIVYKINAIEKIVFSITGWRPFPPEIYYFSKIPAVVIPSDIVTIACLSVLSSLLFSLHPSIRASRYNPVDVLRYE